MRLQRGGRRETSDEWYVTEQHRGDRLRKEVIREHRRPAMCALIVLILRRGSACERSGADAGTAAGAALPAGSNEQEGKGYDATRQVHFSGHDRRRPRAGGVVQPGRPGRSAGAHRHRTDRKSTRLNSSHVAISYAVFCLKKKRP